MNNRKDLRMLLDKPIWQLNGREFVELMKSTLMEMESGKEEEPRKRFVFGLDGICDLFGCSKSTAERIKKSGIIDAAITQVKRKIVLDAELALQLFGNKMKEESDNVGNASPDFGKDLQTVLEVSPSNVPTNQGRTAR